MLVRSQLESGHLHMLLELTLRGKVYRFSSRTVTIPWSGHSPANLLFRGGLLSPVEFNDDSSAPGEVSGSPTTQVEVRFTADDADGWAAVADIDHDLGDATGELSLYREGDDYDDRQVLVSGYITSVAYGTKAESVSMSIESRRVEAVSRLPDDSAQITRTTWPNISGSPNYKLDEGSLNRFYPEVFGSPGLLQGGEDFTEFHGVPAHVVVLDQTNSPPDNASNPATVLLANGQIVGSTVKLYNTTTGSSAVVTTAFGLDSLGRNVTTASVNNATLPISEGDELWWSAAAEGEGGLKGWNETGTSMRGAGEIIEYLVGLSGRTDLDLVSLREVAHLLDTFRLDFYLDEQVSPEQVLFDDVLPLVPVSIDRGRFVYWRFGAEPSAAVAEIDTATTGGWLQGRVQRSSPNVVRNVFRIDYALDSHRNEYMRRLVLGPDRSDDPDVHPNPFSAASVTRYGIRAAPPLQTALVDDPGTAWAVLRWRVLRDSQTHRMATFSLPQSYQHLQPGDVVVVSHDPVEWEDEVCLVRSVTRAPGATLVGVETASNWAREQGS